VTDSYKRYLEGRFREHFKLVGTPLRIEMRSRRATPSTKTRALSPASLLNVVLRGAFPAPTRGPV
jgi:hypothetical protein